MEVVQAYLKGEGGYGYLAKKYNLPSPRTIEYWVHAYNTLGENSLTRSRQNNKYSLQFKLSVVELYLSSEVSYQELALSQGINNPSLIARWVNDFRIAGPDALRPKKKVQRIMQKLGFQVTSFTRKSRRYNSYKGNVGKIAPNRINRRFNTSVPHQKITTDTTEFKYYEIDNKGRMVIKKLYLDPFLDMFNGEILTYCISKTPSATSVLSAQQQAIAITSDCPYRRTFHSDRGWAYQMGAYSSALKENKIFQSMSRKGNCYDNSVMENFFGILKQEMYYGTTYYSFDELKEAIERYIKYYNETIIKEKLGWMSPVKYRLNTIAA